MSTPAREPCAGRGTGRDTAGPGSASRRDGPARPGACPLPPRGWPPPPPGSPPMPPAAAPGCGAGAGSRAASGAPSWKCSVRPSTGTPARSSARCRAGWSRISSCSVSGRSAVSSILAGPSGWRTMPTWTRPSSAGSSRTTTRLGPADDAAARNAGPSWSGAGMAGAACGMTAAAAAEKAPVGAGAGMVPAGIMGGQGVPGAGSSLSSGGVSDAVAATAPAASDRTGAMPTMAVAGGPAAGCVPGPAALAAAAGASPGSEGDAPSAERLMAVAARPAAPAALSRAGCCAPCCTVAAKAGTAATGAGLELTSTEAAAPDRPGCRPACVRVPSATGVAAPGDGWTGLGGDWTAGAEAAALPPGCAASITDAVPAPPDNRPLLPSPVEVAAGAAAASKGAPWGRNACPTPAGTGIEASPSPVARCKPSCCCSDAASSFPATFAKPPGPAPAPLPDGPGRAEADGAAPAAVDKGPAGMPGAREMLERTRVAAAASGLAACDDPAGAGRAGAMAPPAADATMPAKPWPVPDRPCPGAAGPDRARRRGIRVSAAEPGAAEGIMPRHEQAAGQQAAGQPAADRKSIQMPSAPAVSVRR